jgi:hypothetical protein
VARLHMESRPRRRDYELTICRGMVISQIFAK